MQAVPSGYRHIQIDEKGVAYIDDTRIKVRHIAIEHLQYSWSPTELRMQHPSLSLAQIHAALAYYFDNKTAIDQEIAEEIKFADQFAEQYKGSLVREWTPRAE